jgi:peroxiredoxin Q/BCP
MKIGDKVEDFSATDQHGSTVRLSTLLADGPVVLFFYPKASTAGCTAEACHFRDLAAEFAAQGTRPVGISTDSTEDQAAFDQQNQLGLTLLSDPDKAIASALGAKRMGPIFNRRATYVIDADATLLAEIRDERNMDVHADRALEVLAKR